MLRTCQATDALPEPVLLFSELSQRAALEEPLQGVLASLSDAGLLFPSGAGVSLPPSCLLAILAVARETGAGLLDPFPDSQQQWWVTRGV